MGFSLRADTPPTDMDTPHLALLRIYTKIIFGLHFTRVKIALFDT